MSRRSLACCACSGMSASACLPTVPISSTRIMSSERRPDARSGVDGDNGGEQLRHDDGGTHEWREKEATNNGSSGGTNGVSDGRNGARPVANTSASEMHPLRSVHSARSGRLFRAHYTHPATRVLHTDPSGGRRADEQQQPQQAAVRALADRIF